MAFSKIRNEKVARVVGFNVWGRCFGMERRGVRAERAPRRRLDHALEPHSRGKLGKPRKCVVIGCFGFRQRGRGGEGVSREVFWVRNGRRGSFLRRRAGCTVNFLRLRRAKMTPPPPNRGNLLVLKNFWAFFWSWEPRAAECPLPFSPNCAHLEEYRN